MIIKAAWTLAIFVALMMTVVPQGRAGQAQAVSVGSSCNSWDGDLTIVGVDNQQSATIKICATRWARCSLIIVST
jgi:hypothetical protein